MGSTLITFKYIMVMIGMILCVGWIWCKDVNEWQHEDPNRINPNMTKEDIEGSIRQNGVNETFNQTHPWENN